jgi:hypothetical protein
LSGGGGGGGNQNITSTVTQRTDPPEYVKPYATSLLSGGSQIASRPYQPYTGMAVAPLADETQAGMYLAAQRAAQGSPVTAAANQAAINQMGGGDLAYGMGLASQPYGQQISQMQAPGGQYQIGASPLTGIGANQAWGAGPGGIGTNTAWQNLPQQAGQNTSWATTPLGAIGTNPVGRNALLGLDNPYLQEQIRYAQAEMLPQLGYMQRQGGSYGNTGMNEAVAKSMGGVASDMRMQDYALQAQLGESDLGRRNAAWESAANRQMDAWSQQQTGQSANYENAANRAASLWGQQQAGLSGNFENAAQRAMNTWQSMQAGQAGNFENAAQRAMNVWSGQEAQKQQAYESDLARQMSAWESSRNAQQQAFEATRAAQLGAWGDVGSRGLQAMQLAPQLAGQDYTDAQMLMGVGDAKRAYQQSLIDNAMGQWDASMNWPYSQYDWFANLMRGAGWGTYGTGSSTTTQPNPNAQSGLANYLGAGMGGLGLLSGLFG